MYWCAHKTATLTSIQHTVPYYVFGNLNVLSIDSEVLALGMNEQELPNLLSMLRYGNISVMSDSNPRTAVTLDQMRDVYRVLSGNKDRPLTR